MYKRLLEPIINQVLSISPVVLISGARQVGKSTLAMKLFENYILLDDIAIRAAAEEDPIGFIESLEKPVCIDEIQKVPKLLEAIKNYVDKNRKNGLFLLTGSASILDMKGIGDTLAGRIVNLVMWPLSSKERADKLENVIDLLFESDFKNLKLKNKNEVILEYILTGGYPEAIAIQDPRLRSFWFSSYISTYIERDVRDIGEIRNLSNFIKLVNILSSRSGNILKIKELANSSGLSENTASNYLTLLEMVYQIKLIPAYSANFSKRFIKSPKFYFTDTGILLHLLGIHTIDELIKSKYKGLVLETYVLNELIKHIDLAKNRAKIYHYRTTDQKEIDFILESAKGTIAIEVKYSKNVNLKSFKHIIDFKKKSKKLYKGIVFYLGDTILPFGEDLFAVPISFFG